LTLDPEKIARGQSSISYLRETWRKMRVSLKRLLGRSIEFIVVVQRQKSGVAHLHVLIGAYLPQDWLSAAWERVGGGKIVDIRWVDVHRVSAYLSKYLTDRALAELPSGTRRFSCSQGIVLWPSKLGKSGWWLCVRSIDELREHAKQVYEERWEKGEEGFWMLAFFSAEFLKLAALENYNPRRKI